MAKSKTTKAKPKTAKAKETVEIKKPKESTKVKETKEIPKTKEPEKVKETPQIENTLLENIKKNYLLIIISLIVLIVAIVLITNNNSTVITFNTNGGSTIKNVVVENGKFKMPEDPVKEGFIFSGWLEDGKLFDLNKEITTNTTLEATWISVDSKIYEVTFKYDNSKDDVITKVEENKKTPSPTNPTKDGYEFDGWYLGENVYDFNLPVTSNLTLLAKWKEKAAPKDFEEEKEADASCNEGYKLSEGKCIKTETIVANKGCASGYTLKNNTCTKIEEKNATEGCPNNKILLNGSCWTLSENQNMGVNQDKPCNAGLELNEDEMMCITTTYDHVDPIKCSSGYFIKDTEKCHNFAGTANAQGKCSDVGYQVFPLTSTTNCYVIKANSSVPYCPTKEGFIAKKRGAEDGISCAYYKEEYINWMCKDGVSTIMGGKCYKDKIALSQVCEAGYTVNGIKCQKTLTSNTQLACNSGYNLNGSNCTREVSVTPNLSCPSGFKLSGTKCYK